MEYQAVSSHYAGGLNEKVTKLLREGFKLQGGISMAKSGNDLYVAQSLVREAQAGGKRKSRRSSCGKRKTRRN